MSSMTSGVKMRLWPSWLCCVGAFSSAMRNLLEHELALGGLERVVVAELLAAHELLEPRWAAKVIAGELALDQLGVRVGPFAGTAVDPQRSDLAGDVDHPVVHRVAQPRADVAADDLATPLHHEPGHRAGVAHDQDRTALL